MNAVLPPKPKPAEIELRADGLAILRGTTLKVGELVLAQRAFGWSAGELQEQFPHLAPDQIQAALSYYQDHQAEIDADLAARARQVEDWRREAGPSPLTERLHGRR